MSERIPKENGDYQMVFYVYESDVEDPRFSFWLENLDEESGVCLYDRPPEGAGMWLDPDIGGDYEPTTPTDDFEQVLADLMGDGVDAGKVAELPSHEEYFFRVIHGTIDANPEGVPEAIWTYLHNSKERVEQ